MRNDRRIAVVGALVAFALHVGLIAFVLLMKPPARAAVKAVKRVRVSIVKRPQKPAEAPIAPVAKEPKQVAEIKKPVPRKVRKKGPRPKEPRTESPAQKEPVKSATNAPKTPAPAADPRPRFSLSMDLTVDGGGVAVPVRTGGSGASPGSGSGLRPPATQAGGAGGGKAVFDAADISEAPELLAKPSASDLQRAYPPAARQAGLEATVRMKILVSKAGQVVKVRVLRGAGNDFDQAARKLVKQYRFTAGKLNGKSVSAWIPWVYKFRLNG